MKSAIMTAWQRKRFRDYWAALSKHQGPGRPPVAKEVQDLIRKLSGANIGWGVPRIAGNSVRSESISRSPPEEKYRIKHSKPPSPTGKSFIANHLDDLVAIDFFVVLTMNFKILYARVVLALAA